MVPMKTTFRTIKKLAIEESNHYQLTRSQQRQKDLGEVFTPTNLVIDILKKIYPRGTKEWRDETKTFLDPACGNGQFLAPILIIKLELGHDPIQALSTIYGVDIMEDNIEECRDRLYNIAIKYTNKKTECRRIVERNIVCADGLTYDYSFGGPNDNAR